MVQWWTLILRNSQNCKSGMSGGREERESRARGAWEVSRGSITEVVAGHGNILILL